jgi:hypothetical protein
MVRCGEAVKKWDWLRAALRKPWKIGGREGACPNFFTASEIGGASAAGSFGEPATVAFVVSLAVSAAIGTAHINDRMRMAGKAVWCVAFILSLSRSGCEKMGLAPSGNGENPGKTRCLSQSFHSLGADGGKHGTGSLCEWQSFAASIRNVASAIGACPRFSLRSSKRNDPWPTLDARHCGS